MTWTRSLAAVALLACAACRVPTRRDMILGMNGVTAVGGASLVVYSLAADDDDGTWNAGYAWGGVAMMAVAALSTVLVYAFPQPQGENPLAPPKRR